jgi:malonyl CoA-acyl carrier protein transacylase
MKKAYVFPGQGAQFVGMGKDYNAPQISDSKLNQKKYNFAV